tara:strand:+ start:762 stop:1190 length:429 start_codon:yes stop_codon:yes gene_type:complete
MTKELQTFDKFDPTATIKDIELSTVYITSLQNMITEMIYDETKIDTVGETFIKFDEIKKASEAGDKDKIKTIQLDNWERKVYTLFSLLQVFKFKAIDQGLNQRTETTATKNDIKELGELLMKGDKKSLEKLEEIESKMKIVK